MFLLKLFFEFGILVPAYLVFEVAVPVLRERTKFPLTRWCLKRVVALKPRSTTVEMVAEASRLRLANAEKRLAAAQVDYDAAKLEKVALKLEDDTNDLRTHDE
jgi:hypothetical protein